MMTQQTSSTFGCFPAVLVALVLGFLAFVGIRQTAVITEPIAPIEAQAQQIPTEVTNGVESLTIIEMVETQVSASVPATITLQISGYHPDGCRFPAQVQQVRTGDTVTVKIYRIVPKNVMCTMDLNPYSDTVILEGTFESGTYTVDVNGTVVVVKV